MAHDTFFDKYEYTFTVAKNEQGEQDFEYCRYDSENLMIFTMYSKEFANFVDIMFDINSKFDLNLDEFEEEDISYEKCQDVLDFLKENKTNVPTFISALEYAIKEKRTLYVEI